MPSGADEGAIAESIRPGPAKDEVRNPEEKVHTEIEKLRILLPHWIEHNAEHAAEFRSWAGRVAPSREQIESAARHLEAANEALQEALEQLGGPLKGHGREGGS
jgi:FtsZ-binding cell division protein ZapB